MMPSFYATSRDALFRFGRDLRGLPKEEPAAESPSIVIPPTTATRCRDNDASGAARRAKEMMERNHLI
jgi:tRNA(Leu) C34 or U34 (ribose-2'-O)-methylase TrmL